MDLSTRKDCRPKIEDRAHTYLLKLTNKDSEKEMTLDQSRTNPESRMKTLISNSAFIVILKDR